MPRMKEERVYYAKGEWVGWIRRAPGEPSCKPRGWQPVVAASDAAACHALLEEFRDARPWSVCEWVVLKAGEKPEDLRKAG